MTEKEFEKRNFVNWYCLYATPKEIENAKRTNKTEMDRLINEYSYEIEMINLSRGLYEKYFEISKTR
ncbi:MAG: histidine kinase [Candidatus Scalindua rubra]|uniref:Histidine kinase n=1 Tax=Candidatus Scalindua rubra TaxID=1872076 RepID=A0A1E3X9Z9_9BACT|nr:MAG: histidine kinase [Candidatus Scalindua rubra]